MVREPWPAHHRCAPTGEVLICIANWNKERNVEKPRRLTKPTRTGKGANLARSSPHQIDHILGAELIYRVVRESNGVPVGSSRANVVIWEAKPCRLSDY